MISEGSCDTADWNNEVKNSALHHRNKIHFKISITTENSYNISKFDSFYCILYQINAALVSIRDFSSKDHTNLNNLNCSVCDT